MSGKQNRMQRAYDSVNSRHPNKQHTCLTFCFTLSFILLLDFQLPTPLHFVKCVFSVFFWSCPRFLVFNILCYHFACTQVFYRDSENIHYFERDHVAKLC